MRKKTILIKHIIKAHRATDTIECKFNYEKVIKWFEENNFNVTEFAKIRTKDCLERWKNLPKNK